VIDHASAGDFLVFRIQGQEFCLEIGAVREIRSATKAVPLPNSPVEFKGLINLRGIVLPIVDMASRLGLAVVNPPINPVIIVAEVGDRIVGLEVDIVDDIISVGEAEIQSVPTIPTGGIQEFVRGIVNISNRLICLLAIDRLLPAERAAAE
jgi:purine-binding chemotaxis protein CheW